MEKYIITKKAKTPKGSDITYFFMGWMLGMAHYSTKREDAKEMISIQAQQTLSILRTNPSRYGKKYVKGIRMVPIMLALLICLCSMAQDTIPVYIYADDTTYRPDLWYQVQDVNGDTTNIHYSNEYFQTIWGWMIDSAYFDLSFQPLDPKFHVLSSDLRTKTLSHCTQEIIQGEHTTTLSISDTTQLYYFGQPHMVEIREEYLVDKIKRLWKSLFHKGSLMTGESQKPSAS